MFFGGCVKLFRLSFIVLDVVESWGYYCLCRIENRSFKFCDDIMLYIVKMRGFFLDYLRMNIVWEIKMVLF